MSEQRPGRYQRSFGGLVGALVVLVGVIGAFVVLRELNRSEPADPVRAVEYRQPARLAQDVAEFDVLAPRRLPDGWIATSVRFEDRSPQSWHLGFLTEERRYVGLEQAQRPASGMVEEFVDENATAGEDVSIDGSPWQSYTHERDRALVRYDKRREVTTLVVGTAPEDQLVGFVQSLR